MKRIFGGLSVLAAFVVACGIALAGGTGQVPSRHYVDDLTQRSLIQPHRFAMTATSDVAKLGWSGWNRHIAVGSGILQVNTCSPNCATGKVEDFPAKLELRGSRRDQGRNYYAQYRVVGRSLPKAEQRAFGHWTDAYVPSDFK